MLIAAAEVGVNLAGQECVLGDVRPTGIFVERQEKQPDDADEDAKQRQVGRKLEDARVASQA